jgi:WD40 repeat protein
LRKFVIIKNYYKNLRYDATSYELIMTLNGHASNSFIRDLEWKNNDLGLVTACNGGTLNYWESSSGKRTVEFYYKPKKTNTLFYDQVYDYLLVACDDQKLRIFTEKGQTNVIFILKII